MAKRKKKGQGAKLRRSCGAMAAHMMLLERYPSFRLNQMRLEGATAKRRDTGIDLAKAKLVTIKTVVNVVYKTAEQNISDAQIRSQITGAEQGLPRDQPRQEPDARAMEGAGHRCADPVQARQGHAHEDDEDRVHVRRRGQEGRDGWHRAVQPEDASEPVGLRADRRTARLRAVSRAALQRPTVW